MKLVIVDIGSNSVRCMQAESTADGFGFSDKHIDTTRLADGLIRSGRLSDARMEDTLSVLASIKRHSGDLPVCAYATSAVRDAVNGGAFAVRVSKLLGRPVAVLSGAEEALYARRGAKVSGGLIDIGGGSTQIVTADHAVSFPLGCVRMLDRFGDLPFEALYAAAAPLFMETYLLPQLPAQPFTAVGGTATTLAALCLGLDCYDRQKIEAYSMTPGSLHTQLCLLSDMGNATRRTHPLLKKRHDVILHGGAILLYLMRALSIESLHFSGADGMEGFAYAVFEELGHSTI